MSPTRLLTAYMARALHAALTGKPNYLDKPADELVKGKAMKKISRS